MVFASFLSKAKLELKRLRSIKNEDKINHHGISRGMKGNDRKRIAHKLWKFMAPKGNEPKTKYLSNKTYH